jgi:hypothetical protein
MPTTCVIKFKSECKNYFMDTGFTNLHRIFFYGAESLPDKLDLGYKKSETENEAGLLGRPDC